MKRKYLSVLLVFSLLMSLFAIPASAYVSEQDKASGNAAAIEKATKDYNDAAARGDTAGMAAAHAAAESIRNASGYSGGSDGTGSSSSGSSSSGSRSSGGSSSGGSSYSGGSSSGSSSGGSSSSNSSSSTADKTQQMAENSAAWYVAKSAYDAAVASGDSAAAAKAQSTMDNLHEKNTALANDIAGKGGSVSYNASTGVTTITTRDGTRITNADGKSQDGSSIGMTYQIKDSNYNYTNVSSSQFSEAGIKSYLNAGGDIDGLVAAYNQTAKDVAENWKYGSEEEHLDITSEINIVKQWFPDISSSELNALKASLQEAKEDYADAYDAYIAARDRGDSAGMQTALDAMHAANAAAEDARGKVGYSGNSSVTADNLTNDGGFFSAGTQPTKAAGTPSRDGTGVVTFSKTYDIVATAVGGGTISPSGTTHVTEGGSQTYTMTANTGYEIADVVVDGVSKGAVTSYTFSNVNSAHTIKASFQQKSCDITASCGTGGKISPSGKSIVKYGESKTHTITPNSGFDIADVVVDGVSKGAVKTYTFSNVTESHTISASFRANGKVDINTLDVTDNLGTDLSKNSIKSGYGIKVSVPVTATNVSDVNVTLSYNFGDGAKSVTLQKSIGVYVLPINTSSKTLARCVYIPVATADGAYTLTVTVTAKNAAGEMLSDTSSAVITVLGSMYEDDFTGDS